MFDRKNATKCLCSCCGTNTNLMYDDVECTYLCMDCIEELEAQIEQEHKSLDEESEETLKELLAEEIYRRYL